MHSSVMLKRSF